MQRRSFFKTLLAGIAVSGAAASVARAATPSAKQKVAYHLSDDTRVRFVLGNIQNHINGVGGPGNVDIVLVVHGPAVAAFQDLSADPSVKETVARLHTASRVKLNVCGNTLNKEKIDVSDLVPGFVRVDQGGVVRLAQLQAEGYAYLRP